MSIDRARRLVLERLGSGSTTMVRLHLALSVVPHGRMAPTLMAMPCCLSARTSSASCPVATMPCAWAQGRG